MPCDNATAATVTPLRHELTTAVVSFHTVIYLIFQFNFDSFHLSKDFRSFIPGPDGSSGETSEDKYEMRILQFNFCLRIGERERVIGGGRGNIGWCAFASIRIILRPARATSTIRVYVWV